MAPTTVLTLLCFFLTSLCFNTPPTTAQTCRTSCSGSHDHLPIRFPFGFNNTLNNPCSYPGFTLSCGPQNTTTLQLPNSAEFIVRNIDYESQTITIKDTDSSSCLLGRFLDGSLNLTDATPFIVNSSLTFYNCSSEVSGNGLGPGARVVPCLSSQNHTIVVITAFEIEFDNYLASSNCNLLTIASLPPLWWNYPDTTDEYTLEWDKPDCAACERRGRTCRFKNNRSLEVRCSGASKGGIPRSAKYGIIVGVGVPGLLCLIGLSCYICSKINAYTQRRRNPVPEFSLSESQQTAVKVAGLDALTIESYPKTLLGESRRLPNPNDSTCPICLTEYQPKDALRTIPDCKHYFHVGCIDEWLKLNTTCPLCRNSPGGSFSSTPSTVSTSSSSSLLSRAV